MKLLIVCHGETIGGYDNPPLNENGRRQIQDLGAAIKQELATWGIARNGDNPGRVVVLSSNGIAPQQSRNLIAETLDVEAEPDEVMFLHQAREVVGRENPDAVIFVGTNLNSSLMQQIAGTLIGMTIPRETLRSLRNGEAFAFDPSAGGYTLLSHKDAAAERAVAPG